MDFQFKKEKLKGKENSVSSLVAITISEKKKNERFDFCFQSHQDANKNFVTPEQS